MTKDGRLKGGELVTETFDYTGARSPRMLELIGYPKLNGEGITKTLRALAARFS